MTDFDHAANFGGADSPITGVVAFAQSEPFISVNTMAGAAMVVGLLLIAYAWRRNVLAKGRVQVAKAAPKAEVPPAITADMTELTEELLARLDAKASQVEALTIRLETLLAEAERRVGELQQTRATPETDRSSRSRSLEQDSGEGDSSHRDVYALADQGLRPVDIARKLERPTGQVELILNLRRGAARMA
jgi:hypothetical protein